MEDISSKPRLRPVVYNTNSHRRGAQNTSQQLLLLKALQVTQDPKKLKEMIHVKTVADVFRTLDKIVMRKEYHKALNKLGLSFDFIAGGIKDIAVSAEKDDVRLKAYQTLLKSLGVDKYDVESSGMGGTWEEILLEKIEAEKALPVGSVGKTIIPKYDVIVPEIPESVRLAQEEEDEVISIIYDEKK